MRRNYYPILATAVLGLIAPSAGANDNHDAYLRGRLVAAVKKYGVPAMQAAVWTHGGIQAMAVYGRRRLDRPNPAQITDAFHIGSITKPITSTLICRLNEFGYFPDGLVSKLSSTHGNLFGVGDYKQYKSATLLEFMSHVDGMHYQPETEPADEYASYGITNLRERRNQYVDDAIKDQPYGKLGEKRVYAGGHIVAASMLEHIMNLPWEDLVRSYVFDPLEMYSGGFGPTSKTNATTGIWEHGWANHQIYVRQFPDNYEYEPHAPAGRNVHATMKDLCLFGASHLNANSGAVRILNDSSLTILRTVFFPNATNLDGDVAPMTPAWIPGTMKENGVDKKMYWHNGDNGFNYAFLSVAPTVGTGYVSAVATNVTSLEGGPGDEAVDDVRHAAVALEDRYNMIGDLSSNTTIGHPASIYGLGSDAKYAVDNNYSTYATILVNSGLIVDFGTTHLVRSFHIGQELPGTITAFSIQYRSSTTEAWHTAYTGTTPNKDAWHSLGSKIARYWRLNVDGATGSLVHIQEFWLK